jgi:hypothetical protein
VDEQHRRISLSIDFGIRTDHREHLSDGGPPQRCAFDVVGSAYDRLLSAWDTAGANWGGAPVSSRSEPSVRSVSPVVSSRVPLRPQ